MNSTRSARRVLVATGSRAEFGLLEPVMHAIHGNPGLELIVAAAGSHLIGPAETWRDIEAAGFAIAARVEMQRSGASAGHATRLDDAESVGRGIEGFARVLRDTRPEWVIVLGDRIEAFAAASAASIGGIALAHIHGGDRAEGIADEAMRHAITKLAHVHFAATEQSAARIIHMGESSHRVFNVGSPAIDGLADVAPMTVAEFAHHGEPDALFLLHPSGVGEAEEREIIGEALAGIEASGARPLLFAPNHDAGREIVMEELHRASRSNGWRIVEHLPRGRFLALLARLAADPRGVMVGNSSAALIEAAALRLPAVNIGPRQAGRERAGNAIDASGIKADAVALAIRDAREIQRQTMTHPYGSGNAGEQVASLLAEIDPRETGLLRKRNAY